MIRLVFVFFSSILLSMLIRILFNIEDLFIHFVLGFIYGGFIADKLMDMLGFPK